MESVKVENGRDGHKTLDFLSTFFEHFLIDTWTFGVCSYTTCSKCLGYHSYQLLLPSRLSEASTRFYPNHIYQEHRARQHDEHPQPTSRNPSQHLKPLVRTIKQRDILLCVDVSGAPLDCGSCVEDLAHLRLRDVLGDPLCSQDRLESADRCQRVELDD